MKALMGILLAAALCTGGNVAVAQSWHGDDHGQDHGQDRDHRHDRDDHYRDDRRGYDHGRYPPGRAVGLRHRWERGHRYTGPVYVVRDYGHYRLRPPPRGYHWVRDNDNNMLLVAITTGIILDIATH